MRTEVLVVRDASSLSAGVAQFTCPSRLTDHLGRVVIREPRPRPCKPDHSLTSSLANKLYSMLGAQHVVFLVTWQKGKYKSEQLTKMIQNRGKNITKVSPGLEPGFLESFIHRMSKSNVLTSYTTRPYAPALQILCYHQARMLIFKTRIEASSLVSRICFWVHLAA